MAYSVYNFTAPQILYIPKQFEITGITIEMLNNYRLIKRLINHCNA
uniref:Uncharacterized protein n=1 Tax=Virgibacillus oceani TaxID=1479511 RepID=A0A917M8M5_9BACI|nr:hypothetical protein GCM10011398_35040 [Virgibacillus oceani]